VKPAFKTIGKIILGKMISIILKTNYFAKFLFLGMQLNQLPLLCCAEGGVDSAGLTPKDVMPDLIRHPEGFECTRFRLQFIPHWTRGRNDVSRQRFSFCEFFNRVAHEFYHQHFLAG
jgi:hypothetical protein